MVQDNSNLFRRRDTFFGICEGVGADFGFNPLWLRLAFIAPLFFFPVQTVTAYFGLGAIVLVSRLLFPAPVPTGELAALTEVAADQEGGKKADELALAA